MSENIINDEKLNSKEIKEKEIELVLSILKTRKELEIACLNFEYAEEELIDYYAYQIKAYRSKLDYLIKRAKRKGVVLDNISRMEIKLNKAI